MKTRCKFKCTEVKALEGMEIVVFEPRYSDDPSDENRSFSKFTPSGKLELSITNEKLVGNFKPGKQYYIDIEEVPEA